MKKEDSGKLGYRIIVIYLILSLFITTGASVLSVAINSKANKPLNVRGSEQSVTIFDEDTVSDTKVHFLDVGQGLSILVQSEDKVLIYDGGDRSSSSFVVSYLKKQGITQIDYAIASHYDDDHLSGLLGCLNAFTINHVIGPDYVHDSELYRSFTETVDEKNIEVMHPSVGDTFDIGAASFTVLLAEHTNSLDSNANSIAIKLTSGKNSFLFTGDSSIEEESKIINSGLDISADVLCLGHHGSADSTSWDFLKETVPEYAIISCGEDNPYQHPDGETTEKLSSMEIPLFRTDMQGTIVAASDGENIMWNDSPCNDYSPGDVSSEESEVLIPPATEQEETAPPSNNTTVWIPRTGSKYHKYADCSNMNNPSPTTPADAEARGYEPCKKCY